MEKPLIPQPESDQNSSDKLRLNNELQLELIANSGISAEEWINNYAKSFREIIDDINIKTLAKQNKKEALKLIASRLYH